MTSRDSEGEEVSQLYLWGRSAVEKEAPPPSIEGQNQTNIL